MRRMFDLVRNQDPLVMPPFVSVRYACQCMRDRKVGAVLVADRERRLLGIFTGRDAVGRVVADGKDPDKTKISEVMTADPAALPPRHLAIEALRRMADIGCRHMPIVEDGRVVGVVSRADFSGLELDRLDEEAGLWERL